LLIKANIKDIPAWERTEAVGIFTEAFTDDPLFKFAFPETEEREKLTKLMYEFVVMDMVPELNLTIKGVYKENKLAGCIIYTTPKSDQWSNKMMGAVSKMREKADNPRINLIGEFAMLDKYEPGVKYCYGNELAVKKDYRRKGIADKLIKTMINDCKSYPEVKGILIDTANKENITLYEKWGWELKQTTDFYSIKKYFMWKELKNNPGLLRASLFPHPRE
jgi:GNAT superfamily N-acetyltransferase